jgi:hypothetical protein
MATLHDRIRVTLHGPLSGAYKAVYDTREAQLTITYGTAKAVLDEDECDRLLRMWEYTEDADGDLAEFFEELPGFRGIGWRVGQGFLSHTERLAWLVYA